MIKVFSAILFMIGIPVLSSGQIIPYHLSTNPDVKDSTLKAGFINPPSESRLRCYWWWLNGMATKTSITRDLTEMKEKGYGGASIVDAGSSNYAVAAKTTAGPVFMSKEWMGLYQHAIREADRLGIELSVNIQSGWNPGGPFIRPEHAMKKIVWSETLVTGGQEVNLTLSYPDTNLYYRDITVQAFRTHEDCPMGNRAILDWDKKAFEKEIGWKGIYPLHILSEDFTGVDSSCLIDPKGIIDLSPFFKNNKLIWKVPPGNWTIIRYGYTCTGAQTSTTSDGWNGLSLDHLSPAAFHLFADSVVIPLITAAQEAGNSLHYLQTDSWEMGVASWTEFFPDEFKKYQGYDIFPYLPVLAGRIVGNRSISNRFLHDFRQTISECVEHNHYRLLSDLAHRYGLGIHPESGGPHSAPVDALKVMAVSDFPQGEFWATANTHRIKDDERLSVRQSACVAHTNGKRFVAAEGPTSIGPQWERSPKDLKGNIDRVFCSGVNRIVWHTFTSSPEEFGKPGNEYFAGTHLNPNTTWWTQAGDFISYLNRCSFMLQQGLFVADVLCYYGDEVPNFVFLKEELTELKPGHDWDKCSRDVILNRVCYENNRLVLPDGMSYRIMMIKSVNGLDLQVLEKIESLVRQGMTLVAPKPAQMSGLQLGKEDEIKFNTLVRALWGNLDGVNLKEQAYGRGRVIWGKDVNDVLESMHTTPDFTYESKDPATSLDYIHRHLKEQEIYFISNRFAWKGVSDFQYRPQINVPDRYEEVICKFRVKGMIPEIWNPLTGEIFSLPFYTEKDGMISLPLHLAPEGSVFVIFKKAKPKTHLVQINSIRHKDVLNVGAEKSFPMIGVKEIDNHIYISGFHPGTYQLRWNNGKVSQIEFGSCDTFELKHQWSLMFDKDWGGPAKLESDSLKSWVSYTDPGVRYYSGTCIYQKVFDYQAVDNSSYQYVLDLGNVQEMARVFINGFQMPGLWSAPYRCDISPYLKAKGNILSIEVVNMWVNRLVGDSKLPLEKRFTRTNVNKFSGEDSEKYLRPSGLLGPVYILRFPELRLPLK